MALMESLYHTENHFEAKKRDRSEPMDKETNPWAYFDKIYCISLKERPDRRDAARIQFEKAGLSDHVEYYITGKHPTDSEAGIFESHLACIHKGLEAGARHIVILEDDVVFAGFTPEKLRQCVDFMKKNSDWKAFFFGCLISGSRKTPFKGIHAIRYRSLAHAYVLNRGFAEVLAKTHWRNLAFDTELKAHQDGFYAFFPSFAFQSDSPTGNSNIMRLDRFRRLCGGLQRIQKRNECYHHHKPLFIALHLLVLLLVSWFFLKQKEILFPVSWNMIALTVPGAVFFLLVFWILPQAMEQRLRYHDESRPDLGKKTERILHQYRNMGNYQRLFARFKLGLDPMFSELPSLLPKTGIHTIADIGCGYGVPANWLLDRYPKAIFYGFDPDPERVAVASRAIGNRGYTSVAGAPEMPQLPVSVDLAMMLDMVHFLDDDQFRRTLHRLCPVLGRKGRLIVRAALPPEYRFAWVWWIENLKASITKTTCYYRQLNEIKRIVLQAGFEIEKSAPSGSRGDLVWFVLTVGK